MGYGRHGPGCITEILEALCRRRKFDLFAGHTQQRRQLAVVDALIAAGNDQNGLAMHDEAQAFGNLSYRAADGICCQLRGRRRMREKPDGAAEIQGMQRRLHVLRGEGFHRYRPFKMARGSRACYCTKGTSQAPCEVMCYYVAGGSSNGASGAATPECVVYAR